MNYDIQENILYIFTDGASRSVLNEDLKKNTGRNGGKGIRFVYYDNDFNLIEEDKSDYISYTQATNQDMELRAVVDGLKIAKNTDLSTFIKIIVVTDSKFIYENWRCAVFGYWDKPGVSWKTRYGDPVIHKEKRKELRKYRNEINRLYRINIDFEKVKALHKKDNGNRTQYNDYNDKADISAVKGAQSRLRIGGTNITAPRSPFFKDNTWFKEGFLKVDGQEVLIHICNSRYIRKRCLRYNYEVVSRDNGHFIQTGWIFYDKKILSAKYIYFVKIKDDGSHRIEEIISEHSKEYIKQKMIENGIDTSILYGKLGET